MRIKIEVLACVGMMAFTAVAFTTARVPSDGVCRFMFRVSETQDGSIPVPANAVCDVNGELENGQFSYGFLGTTDDSCRTDVPSNLPTVPHAIDGFKVVKEQKIVLHNTTDANGVPCVAGPAASRYSCARRATRHLTRARRSSRSPKATTMRGNRRCTSTARAEPKGRALPWLYGEMPSTGGTRVQGYPPKKRLRLPFQTELFRCESQLTSANQVW